MYNEHGFIYVEDDPLSRDVMQMMLGTVIKAPHFMILSDSQDFLNKVQNADFTPDFFLLDIHVTPLDGFEMLRAIRDDERFAQARIIALTASVMNEEVAQLRTAGFDGAISKPLSVATFPELIGRIVQGESIWHIG
jgi:CheY-like chemotaxis protein